MYQSIKRMNEIFENKISDINIETINKDYEAAKFIFQEENCYFRKVKKTPKKSGYFVF
ncbi:MepB family protein [Mesoplasma chauliocola]|uniref:MepB family protein n=1 Tax=Mesoplasma chauliocola TaxID=216427 RepID=UPI0004BA818C|nr:MepB family protein [Mesoplasma chauliocola]